MGGHFILCSCLIASLIVQLGVLLFVYPSTSTTKSYPSCPLPYAPAAPSGSFGQYFEIRSLSSRGVSVRALLNIFLARGIYLIFPCVWLAASSFFLRSARSFF